jgi:predicted transcriptional regulator
MNQVFKVQGAMDQEDAYHVTGKLLTIQEKVEKVLENRYVLTVDERRLRAKAILSQYMIKPMVEKALGEMEEKNLFNF